MHEETIGQLAHETGEVAPQAGAVAILLVIAALVLLTIAATIRVLGHERRSQRGRPAEADPAKRAIAEERSGAEALPGGAVIVGLFEERIELLLADSADYEDDCAHVFVSVGRDNDERVALVPIHAFLAMVFEWAEALPPEAALDEEGLAMLRRVQIRLGFRGDAEAEAKAMACELERNGGAP
jgi:hypothetical protein